LLGFHQERIGAGLLPKKGFPRGEKERVFPLQYQVAQATLQDLLPPRALQEPSQPQGLHLGAGQGKEQKTLSMTPSHTQGVVGPEGRPLQEILDEDLLAALEEGLAYRLLLQGGFSALGKVRFSRSIPELDPGYPLRLHEEGELGRAEPTLSFASVKVQGYIHQMLSEGRIQGQQIPVGRWQGRIGGLVRSLQGSELSGDGLDFFLLTIQIGQSLSLQDLPQALLGAAEFQEPVDQE